MDPEPQIAPSRYRDSTTAALCILAHEWESLHRSYQASTLRGQQVKEAALREVIEASARGTLALRDEIGKRMASALRKHPVYPWMVAHRGFPKAVHTARLLESIGDPLRFPGRVCSDQGKHHLPEDYQGETCPVAVYGDNGDEPHVCGASVGPVRRGTGTRALWHYAGVHVVNGRMARQQRGKQGDWNPAVRDALLKPDVGLAAQLIRMRVEPWRGVYDEAKERIARERGVDFPFEIVGKDGSAAPAQGTGDEGVEGCSEVDSASGSLPPNEDNGGGVASRGEAEGSDGLAAEDQEGAAGSSAEVDAVSGRPLRPFQIEQRARIIAVKAMLGDLLAEWKRVTV